MIKLDSKSNENISFFDWCTSTGHEYMLNFYSKKNDCPVDSPLLSYHSRKMVRWECEHGHVWYSILKGATSSPRPKEKMCPKCQELIYDANRDAQNEIKREIIAITSRIKKGELFHQCYESHTGPIPLIFKYPSNKYSNIAMYLAEKEGALNRLSYDTYQITYSPADIEKIAIMYVCISHIEHDNKNGKAKDFLERYCLCFMLAKKLLDFTSLDPRKPDHFEEEWKVYRASYKSLYQKVIQTHDAMIASGKFSGKWVSEQRLFALVSHYYPDAIYQHKTQWLGAQSLDIFVPSINVAFEYQGEQHYTSVPFFGGDDALTHRISLDNRKRTLCSKNNVTLLEWKWTEGINPTQLRQRLEEINIVLPQIDIVLESE